MGTNYYSRIQSWQESLVRTCVGWRLIGRKVPTQICCFEHHVFGYGKRQQLEQQECFRKSNFNLNVDKKNGWWCKSSRLCMDAKPSEASAPKSSDWACIVLLNAFSQCKNRTTPRRYLSAFFGYFSIEHWKMDFTHECLGFA